MVGRAADAAHDPLPHIPLEMHQQVSDAVRACISAGPERFGGQHGKTPFDLRGILVRQVMARLLEEFLREAHWSLSPRANTGSLRSSRMDARRSPRQTAMPMYPASVRCIPSVSRMK